MHIYLNIVFLQQLSAMTIGPIVPCTFIFAFFLIFLVYYANCITHKNFHVSLYCTLGSLPYLLHISTSTLDCYCWDT